ncbi:MAG: TfoX/Sxy family protein [Magnetococcales bacterium]|nr:TfoX/Sxy family protein [Magnetococcales bacterium]
MTVTRQFESFVLDQLSHFGYVHSRRMFGGTSLYVDSAMLGLPFPQITNKIGLPVIVIKL